MNCFSLASFHFWIFYNFNFERKITFYFYLTFSLRTILILSISWFDSFNFSFYLTCFFIECCCYSNLTRSTIFYSVDFSSLKFRIVFVSLASRNFFFLNNRLNTDFNNSLNWIFSFFFSYKFVLLLIIRSCNSNLTLFTWSYFFFLAHFNIFIVNIFCFEWFFNFFDNWLDTNFNYLVYRIFSCLEFAFFSFGNLAVFDNKCICSFLFSWCSTCFFTLTSFKIFIILISSFER